MIKLQEFPDRDFETKEEAFKFLKENKKQLISLKKSITKHADAVDFGYLKSSIPAETIKEDGNISITDVNSLEVKVVINTTNFLDSHGDVHIDGIWNKSISDNKSFLHLQEHRRDFKNLISDNAKGSIQVMTWKQLGLPYAGKTEALIFESTIDKDRNEFMLNQYAKKWVKNHSVGMRYVNFDICINSEAEWNKDEKELWDKYYPMIANKELADERGYFWAVTEAKIIEGSAVVMGSNSATPTLENKDIEAVVDTSKNEPSEDTQETVEIPTEKRKLSII